MPPTQTQIHGMWVSQWLCFVATVHKKIQVFPLLSEGDKDKTCPVESDMLEKFYELFSMLDIHLMAISL